LPAESTPVSDEEIAMLVREAKVNGKRVAAHARSCESVKQCIRHGIELIFHASFADEEALDLLEARARTSTSSRPALLGDQHLSSRVGMGDYA